jgi:3-methyladenine DNA glycosylase/8-oxoguanine DNA glycosylase
VKHILKSKQNFDLEAIPPYDFDLSIRKAIEITRGFPPLKDELLNGVYWTTLRGPPIIGMKVRSLGTREKPKISCTLFSENRLTNKEEEKALEEVGWLLGLNEDLSDFYRLSQGNSVLDRAVKGLYGLRIIKGPYVFGSLITAIRLQNAPVRRSNAMIAYLVQSYGEPVTFEGRTYYAPLTPAALSRATITDLREKGKLGYRAAYIKALANEFSPDTEKRLEKLSTEKAKKELMRFKGVGEFTAEFALVGARHNGKRRYDVFPVDSWSSRLYLSFFFPKEDFSALSKEEILHKARDHARDLWGNWRGLVWQYLTKSLL